MFKRWQAPRNKGMFLLVCRERIYSSSKKTPRFRNKTHRHQQTSQISAMASQQTCGASAWGLAGGLLCSGSKERTASLEPCNWKTTIATPSQKPQNPEKNSARWFQRWAKLDWQHFNSDEAPVLVLYEFVQMENKIHESLKRKAQVHFQQLWGRWKAKCLISEVF